MKRTRLFLSFALLVVLCAIGPARAAGAEPFAVGQTWTYETRKGETDSRLTIVRIHAEPKGPRIVFVAVHGLSIRFAANGPSYPWERCHLPVLETALRRSVVKLEREQSSVEAPGFDQTYADWRKQADTGKPPYWTLPVARAIDALETMIRKSRQ
jgi:hypothetical protein